MFFIKKKTIKEGKNCDVATSDVFESYYDKSCGLHPSFIIHVVKLEKKTALQSPIIHLFLVVVRPSDSRRSIPQGREGARKPHRLVSFK